VPSTQEAGEITLAADETVINAKWQQVENLVDYAMG
jgi:hypothetical protein